MGRRAGRGGLPAWLHARQLQVGKDFWNRLLGYPPNLAHAPFHVISAVNNRKELQKAKRMIFV